jgi:hypothetical protein
MKIKRQGTRISRKMGKHVLFSVVRDKIVCLTCRWWCQLQKNTIHYKTLHNDKFGVLEVGLRENKLKNLKCDLQRQQNILTVVTKTNEAAVQTSFIISQIIAKKSKPFTDGDYVKECIMEAAEILCPEKKQFLKISVFLQIRWLNV